MCKKVLLNFRRCYLLMFWIAFLFCKVSEVRDVAAASVSNFTYIFDGKNWKREVFRFLKLPRFLREIGHFDKKNGMNFNIVGIDSFFRLLDFTWNQFCPFHRFKICCFGNFQRVEVFILKNTTLEKMCKFAKHQYWEAQKLA